MIYSSEENAFWLSWVFVPQNAGDVHPKMMVNFKQDKLLAELSY